MALFFSLAGVLASVSAAGALKKPADPEELFNPLLGVEHSHWLVGPIYHIATGDEVESYIGLVSDEDAASFIEEFWARRAAGTEIFKKTPLQIYGKRADTADSRYGEGQVPGRRTDRGTVYILHGEPEDVEFESSEDRDGPPVETWKYPKDAEPGLDGDKPKRSYRFIEVRGTSVFYTRNAHERAKRDIQRTRRRF